MNPHFQRIISEAEERLTLLKKEAEHAADNARKSLGTLAAFAENVPSQMLDTCAEIFVGELVFDDDNKYNWQNGSHEAKLSVSGSTIDFLPYDARRGQPKKIQMKAGRYRVVVTLQKAE